MCVKSCRFLIEESPAHKRNRTQNRIDVVWELLDGYIHGCAMGKIDNSDFSRATHCLSESWIIQSIQGRFMIEFPGVVGPNLHLVFYARGEKLLCIGPVDLLRY